MNTIKTTMPDANKQKIRLVTYMAALYFVCMPFSIVPLPGGVSLLKYISILIGGCLIVNLFFGKKLIHFNMIHLLLGIYILYSVGSLFLLRDDISIDTFRGIIETSMILYLITINSCNKAEHSFLTYCWIFVGIFTAALMIFSSVSLADGSGRATLSFSGGREDPNQLTGYFILPILLCFEKVKDKDKLSVIYIILSIVMIYVVFTTGSRGGLLAVLGAIVAYVFLADSGGLHKKIYVAVFVLILGIVFIYVFIPLLPEGVRERMSVQSVVQDKGSGRIDLWVTVLEALRKMYQVCFLAMVWVQLQIF